VLTLITCTLIDFSLTQTFKKYPSPEKLPTFAFVLLLKSSLSCRSSFSFSFSRYSFATILCEAGGGEAWVSARASKKGRFVLNQRGRFDLGIIHNLISSYYNEILSPFLVK